MAGMFKNMQLPFRQKQQEDAEGAEEEEGESLTTILTTSEDRSSLTILVADCTEVMRQDVIDVFDAKKTGKKVDLKGDLKGDEALVDTDVDPGTVDVGEQDKLKKQLEQREKELNSQKFQDLKSDALKHFDEWRTSVIQRVGEVVNTREEAARETKQAKPKKDETTPERASPPMRFPEPAEYDDGVDQAIGELYAPVDNPLKKLAQEKKVLILHSMLLLLLSLEKYHAQSRVLLLHLTTSLGLSIKYLGHDESKVARGLLSAAENLKADEETKKRAEENKDSRKWKVGLATVAGAALIGVTGGLAAPLLAAGVGSVMGGLGLGATAAAGYLGTLAGSTVLVGGLFGAYGGRMTGKMMDQYAREVEDFGFVPVRSAHKPRKIEKEFRRLRVGIGISGWLSNQDDVVEPWKVYGVEIESFALRWELEALMNLGNGLETMIKSAAWGLAKREIISHTVFAALSAGLWPLALVKVSRIIENPWSVASYRAQKAGEVLADAIINKAQGERPVTLVGYSLGAKVIYTCMQRLAERRAFGLIESVVLIGSPTPSDESDWRLVRSVVAGRVVNVYSTKDYLLGFLYRGSSIQYGVAGLQAIENVKGVENYDVTSMVNGHTSYRYLTGEILRRIGFEDVDKEELEKEKKALREKEEKEAKERDESEKKEQSEGTADPSTGVSDQHVQDLEKEVEKKNEQSYVGWAQEKMVGAGTSASVAYEKAKAQWSMRRQGAGGQAAADATKQADSATSDVSKDAESAGVDTPNAGDAAYQSMRAKSIARKEVPQGSPSGTSPAS
ncbi:uncharacterized protein LTR77_000354 [Saxophila tyrrhenica]|uniref:DUF726-domain-containing protein n=1 Tax=Saxophila tyrrhenica TaxID=1690608 RepID=A0AAV9PN09_9PEZI|nr:hypothetical protein LTR77_000354 [Saxophila tyrrhenica]